MLRIVMASGCFLYNSLIMVEVAIGLEHSMCRGVIPYSSCWRKDGWLLGMDFNVRCSMCRLLLLLLFLLLFLLSSR